MRLNLKLAIVESQRSQRDVAAAAGIPENRFSSIVRGWVVPRAEERQAIAFALSLPIEDLFGSDDAELGCGGVRR